MMQPRQAVLSSPLPTTKVVLFQASRTFSIVDTQEQKEICLSFPAARCGDSGRSSTFAPPSMILDSIAFNVQTNGF